MIDISWWISHLVWAMLGGCAGFLIAAVFAVSGSASRKGEWSDWAMYIEPEPEPVHDSAEVAALKAELAEAQANVEFYYQMATDRTV